MREGERVGGWGGGEGIIDGVVEVSFMCSLWVNTMIGQVSRSADYREFLTLVCTALMSVFEST